MMKTATYIRKLIRPADIDAALYRLSEPHEGYEYVIVSAVDGEPRGPLAIFAEPYVCETFIFGADENGEVDSWQELDGSVQGFTDHAFALAGAGYMITQEDG